MKIITRSIRNQIIFWAGLCLLVSSAAGIVFSTMILTRQANQARAAAIAAGEENAASAARDIAELCNSELNYALHATRTLVQGLSVVSYGATQKAGASPARDTVLTMLKSVLSANPHFMGLYSDWEPNAFDGSDKNNLGRPGADKDGRFTAWWARGDGGAISLQPSDETYADEVQEAYYRLPMETKQEVLMEPYTDQVDGKPYLMTSLIVPILNGQTFLGMAGVDITLNDLQTQVDTLAAGLYDGTAQIDIISHDGLVVAQSGKPESAGKAMKEVNSEDWEKIDSVIRSGQTILRDDDGEIMLFAPIQPGATVTPWTVMLLVPEEKLTEQADAAYRQALHLLWMAVGGCSAFILVALFLLWQAARSLTRPIQQTAGFLSEVAGGSISRDVPAALCGRGDEIGSLARSAQGLVESLRTIFKELNNSVETLGGAADRLLAISAQTAQGASQSSARANTAAAAAEEMSANSISVAGRVEQAAQNIASIAATTEELTATIDEIAGSSEKARATTSGAAQQSGQMLSLMKELGGAAQEIGQVTETITSISAQTNLLALNATIEAARAGAAGRGFAVVANEVKELARQTAVATADISERIASVQRAAAGAVGETEKIARILKDVNDIMASIASGIEEQAAATQDIAGNISQAAAGVHDANWRAGQTAQVSQSIAEEISGVSSTSREVDAASKQTQSCAAELSEIAEQLRRMAAHFTV